MARIIFTLEDGTEIQSELDSNSLVVGRHADSGLVLPSASVSSRHAAIKRRGEDFYVQDLGSTNGTKVNGVQIEDVKLADGDRLMFGDVPAVFHISAPKPAPKAASSPAEVAAPSPPAAAPRRALPPSPGVYRPGAYQSEGGGCAGFLLLVVFLAIAFVGGLCLRHYIETKGNLPVEIFQKIRQKLEILREAESKQGDSEPKSSPPAQAPAPGKDMNK